MWRVCSRQHVTVCVTMDASAPEGIISMQCLQSDYSVMSMPELAMALPDVLKDAMFVLTTTPPDQQA